MGRNQDVQGRVAVQEPEIKRVSALLDDGCAKRVCPPVSSRLGALLHGCRAFAVLLVAVVALTGCSRGYDFAQASRDVEAVFVDALREEGIEVRFQRGVAEPTCYGPDPGLPWALMFEYSVDGEPEEVLEALRDVLPRQEAEPDGVVRLGGRRDEWHGALEANDGNRLKFSREDVDMLEDPSLPPEWVVLPCPSEG